MCQPEVDEIPGFKNLQYEADRSKAHVLEQERAPGIPE